MKKVYFRIIPAIFCICALLFAGCSTGTGITAPQPQTTAPADISQRQMKILSFGQPSEGQLEALSEALGNAGLPMTVEAVSINEASTAASMKSYTDGLPEADLALFYDYSMLSQMYDKGLLLDLTQYRDSYPELFSAVTDTDLAAVRKGGALMAYPLPDSADVPARESSIMLRGDILKELGAEVPTNPEELLELCITARDAGLPCELAVTIEPPYAFHRTYDEWPFYVTGNSLVLINQDGQAESYPGSEIFGKDASLYAQFREEGVLKPLYQNKDMEDFCTKWDALAALYSLTYYEDCPYKDDLILVQFEPERGNIQANPGVFRFIGVSASANPEVALRFLQTAYSKQDVYDALVYGVKEQDWSENADGTVKVIEKSSFGRYFNIAPLNRTQTESVTVKSETFPADTLLDFNPGAYNYATDMDALTRIYSCAGFGNPTSGLLFVRDGSLPMEMLPKTVKALQDAGLDKIVKAYQDGYDAAVGK